MRAPAALPRVSLSAAAAAFGAVVLCLTLGALGPVGLASADPNPPPTVPVSPAQEPAVAPGAADPVGSALGGVANRVVGFGADGVLTAMSEWVASGAAWLLGQVGSAMSATTRPDLGAPWFTRHMATMAGVAAFVVLPLLLVSIIQAVVRQDGSSLVRLALVKLPLALLLTAVAVQLVQLFLSAVDALSSTVGASAGMDSQNFMAGVAEALNAPSALGGSPAVPAFVTFLGSIGVAFGALVLWLELVIRSAAIYVAVLFLPLALAGLVWPTTALWCKRLAETLAALILSKLVIVAVMSLGAGALSGEGGPAGFSGVVAGVALLLLATFVPFALLRLIPAVEAGAVVHLEGVSRKAQKVVPAASSVLQAALVTAEPVGPIGDDIPFEMGKPPPDLSGFAGGGSGGDDGSEPGSETAGAAVGKGRGLLSAPSADWGDTAPGTRVDDGKGDSLE